MPSTNKTIQLASIGNTIIDLEYSVDESLLQELDIEKGSMTLIDLEKKSSLLTKLGSKYTLCCGGSIANSVYIASQLGLTTHHIGVLGDDILAEHTISEYEKYKIGHSFLETAQSGDSGCCIVLITPDGERTMLTYLGVSSRFQSVQFMKSIIKQSHYFIIEGYLLSDDFCNAILINEIIPTAKSEGTSLILSLSDAGLVSFFHPQFEALVSLGFDIIFCNRKEAEALSKETTIDDIRSYFKKYTKELIVTDSENGAYFIDHNTTIHFPTKPVQPTDTTGAGDAFAGAYLAKKIQDQSTSICMETANDVSRVIIQHQGARPRNIQGILTH